MRVYEKHKPFVHAAAPNEQAPAEAIKDQIGSVNKLHDQSR